MLTVITWRLPIKIANESNSSEHWTKKAKRHRLQKARIKAVFNKDKPPITIPCTVVLTRISPRQLDGHDNLPMSLKWVTDSIAENLIPGKAVGRADDSKEITWKYKQEKGKPNEYAVRIEILKEK